MACRIGEFVLKRRDPEVLARFWCEVLDFVELDREEKVYIEIGQREGFGGPQPTIFLIRDDETKNGPARLHIDVSDEELQARLKEWRAPAPRYAPGVMAKYARLVSCASVGAVTG